MSSTIFLSPFLWLSDSNDILSWWILTRTSAWILARDQHLPKNDPELMAELYDKLDSYNVPTEVMFER